MEVLRRGQEVVAGFGSVDSGGVGSDRRSELVVLGNWPACYGLQVESNKSALGWVGKIPHKVVLVCSGMKQAPLVRSGMEFKGKYKGQDS